MRAYLALAAILALIGAYWLGDHNGVSRERDRNTAAASVQKDKVAAKVDEQAQASSEARTSMLDYLAEQKPAIEIRTHDTITKIRQVYVDKPLPAICVRPASVQTRLDAARDAVNAAIGRM